MESGRERWKEEVEGTETEREGSKAEIEGTMAEIKQKHGKGQRWRIRSKRRQSLRQRRHTGETFRETSNRIHKFRMESNSGGISRVGGTAHSGTQRGG